MGRTGALALYLGRARPDPTRHKVDETGRLDERVSDALLFGRTRNSGACIRSRHHAAAQKSERRLGLSRHHDLWPRKSLRADRDASLYPLRERRRRDLSQRQRSVRMDESGEQPRVCKIEEETRKLAPERGSTEPAARSEGEKEEQKEVRTKVLIREGREKKKKGKFNKTFNYTNEIDIQNDKLVKEIHKHAEKFDKKTEESFKFLQVFTALCISA